MRAARHRSITRTFVVIISSASVFVAGCSSDNNSSSGTAAPTTTVSVTATSTATSPPVTTEPPAATTTPTTETSETTAPPVDEPFTSQLQAYLDALNVDGNIVIAHDICTTIDKKYVVPVLAVLGELLVTAPDKTAAKDVVTAFLDSLNLVPAPVVSDVVAYVDSADRPAAGVFLATVQNVTFDLAFMKNLADFNANAALNGPLISLNFLYSMSQVWRFHPSSPPDTNQGEPTDGASGGEARTIAVFDSLYPDPASISIPVPADSADGKVVKYPATAPSGPMNVYGHGPFVRELIKRFASQATVNAYGIAQRIDPQGVFITVADVQAAMSAAFGQVPNTNEPDFEGTPPDVINLSFGGPGCELAAPAVFGDFLKRLVTPGEWAGAPEKVPVIVAAAGNSSADILEYPAAFPNVVAVGSITNEVPDCFSNVGDWIDIWAPGANQVSYYPYAGGWANWSGTSFATARVSALLATLSTTPGGSNVWQQARDNPPIGFSVNPVTTPTQCPAP